MKVWRKSDTYSRMALLILPLMVFAVYNLFILQTDHNIRVSLQKIIEIEDRAFFESGPFSVGQYFRWEDEDVMKKFAFPLPDSIRSVKPSMAKAKNILNYWGYLNNVPNQIDMDLPESPEVISEYMIKRNYKGSCYNDAIVFSALLQREGFITRLLSLEGNDGLGGASHAVTTAWIDSLHKWVMFDPQNTAYFTNKNGEALSDLELRDFFLMSKSKESFEQQVTIYQGLGARVHKDTLFNKYGDIMKDMNYPVTNDLYTLGQTSLYSKFSTWIEKQFEYFGVYAIWAGRYFRSLSGNQAARIRFLDENNKNSYKPNLWYYSFRILLWAWMSSVIILLIIAAKFIRKKVLGKPNIAKAG